MENSPLVLGKNTTYDNEYAPSRLHRIERSLGRSAIKHLKEFNGVDIWRLYEMTYLDLKGLPKVCMGIMYVPSTSKYIVESKSLKLYELSFTMTKFASLKDVEQIFSEDLSKLLETEVKVCLFDLKNKSFNLESPSGICLEEQSFASNLCFRNYDYSPKVLELADSKKTVNKTYYTNLFRSLCPVTSQPDHASIVIEYKGLAPKEESILNYLVSLRNHQGFHEQCVELIYSDLMHYLNPSELTVYAFFTRRGGIDINPVRTSLENKNFSSVRFIRQ